MSEIVYSSWNNNLIDSNIPLEHGRKILSAVIGWGGIRVFDPEADIIELSYEYAKAVQGYSCGQCIPCSVGTKAILDIFDKIRKGKGEEKDLEELKSLSKTISLTSICVIPISRSFLLNTAKRNPRGR